MKQPADYRGKPADYRGRSMNVGLASHDEVSIMQVVSLRLSVGLLGERDNAAWWTSGFMSPTSTAFLAPVFGTQVTHARYQGVLEAARRIHDERIGVGRVFHPFRLPETMEQRIFDTVQSAGHGLVDAFSSPDSAKTILAGLAGKPADIKPGPALVGPVSTLDEPGWVAEVASLYVAAFGAGIQCFPYFAGAR